MSESEAPVIDPQTELSIDGQAVEPPAKPLALDPAEPVDTETPEAEPEAETPAPEIPAAPAVIERLYPDIAGTWSTLNAQQQEAVWASARRHLDQKPEATAEPQQTPEASSEPAEVPRTSERTESSRPASPPVIDLPDGIDERAVDGLITRLFGDEAKDDQDAKVLRSLLVAGIQSVRETKRIAGLVVSADQEVRQFVTTERDERQLEKALVANERDIQLAGIQSEADYDGLAKEALACQKAGRTRNWMDAVSLALLDRRLGRTAPQKPTVTTERRTRQAEALAASLASGKQPRTANARARTFATPGDALRYHARKEGLPLD